MSLCLTVICNLKQIIEQHVNWSEEYGEWQLRGVAYAGNNINQYHSPRRSARSTYVIYA